MKSILEMLDKPENDVLLERVEKEDAMKKYWFHLGASILFLLVTVIISIVSYLRYETKDSPETYAIDLKAKTQQQLNILPYPHQSLPVIASWNLDAITASYSFDFNRYDRQVDRASYFFTPEGYSTYLTSLQMNKIEENVKGRKLQISVIPLGLPVKINSGTFGSTEFYRFKTQVLVSYYGGKSPVLQKMIVETLILRVPGYKNFKSLSIAEFNMTPA